MCSVMKFYDHQNTKLTYIRPNKHKNINVFLRYQKITKSSHWESVEIMDHMELSVKNISSVYVILMNRKMTKRK